MTTNPDAFRPTEQQRADLAAATLGIDLSDQETRILDWLAGWDQDVVGPIVTLLRKARLSPTLWTERRE